MSQLFTFKEICKILNTCVLLSIQKFKVNITGIHDLRQGQSLEPESIKVEYKRNYVTFQCTSEQEGKLIAKLHTTGLAVNIEPFQPSDIHTTGTTENQSSYYNEGYPTNVALELSTVDTDHKVALSDKTVLDTLLWQIVL